MTQLSYLGDVDAVNVGNAFMLKTSTKNWQLCAEITYSFQGIDNWKRGSASGFSNFVRSTSHKRIRPY